MLDVSLNIAPVRYLRSIGYNLSCRKKLVFLSFAILDLISISRQNVELLWDMKTITYKISSNENGQFFDTMTFYLSFALRFYLDA